MPKRKTRKKDFIEKNIWILIYCADKIYFWPFYLKSRLAVILEPQQRVTKQAKSMQDIKIC